jgi:hypothetical protein
MATNQVELRTVEKVMSDYTPTYQPIYPLFLAKSEQYAREVGKLDFRRVDVIGDIRARHVTPKDTELKQITVTDGKKTFKKYFLANQFRRSTFNSQAAAEEVVARVLDEHQIQADEMLLLGDGTSVGTQLNNGLFYSEDANYVLKNSYEIPVSDRLTLFHTKVVEMAALADAVAGRKVILFYGNVIPSFDSLYSSTQIAFKEALQKVLGPNYSMVKIPTAATPSSANGFIIANMDQVKLHYTVLPELMDQGYNAEMLHYWFNFLQGSMMLEVLAPGGVIRQPTTLAV